MIIGPETSPIPNTTGTPVGMEGRCANVALVCPRAHQQVDVERRKQARYINGYYSFYGHKERHTTESVCIFTELVIATFSGGKRST